MTEKLYEQNSHLKEFSATVLSCEKREENFAVVLDKTAFFPESGGQIGDKGHIGKVFVFDTQIENGIIYHFTNEEVTVGETLDCRIDWYTRFQNMQNHSGEHIISGLVHKHFGFDNVGFHLSRNEMTLDFNGFLDEHDLEKIEYLANNAIFENVPFRAYFPENFKELEYRSKLDLTENVRIVEIEGIDRCACCAPHVDSAAEIGVIKILNCIKNKGGVRLFVKCGIQAIAYFDLLLKNAAKVSDMLCVKREETALGVEKQLEQMGELKFKNTDLKHRLINEKVNNFNNDCDITALFETDFDIKELQMYADKLYKTYGGIRAIFSGSEGEYSFAICGEEKSLADLLEKLKESLNVRGGGRNSMIQGTIFATKEEILKIML